jgi:hypothetical protein
MVSQKKTLISKPYKCEYCGSSFLKESTLIAHSCEQKRRHLQKTEKHVMLGYQTFVKFYQKSLNFKGIKTYEEFCKSPYYNAFVKFGSYLNNVRPLYMEKYMDYIVTSGIKLDKWCLDEHYEKYAIEQIRKESVETALERSIDTMAKWAEEKESVWNHYFLYVSSNRLVWNIKDGKISPWLILNCNSGKQALSQLNDEQLDMIFAVLDPEHWSKRFQQSKADVELVKQVVAQSGL